MPPLLVKMQEWVPATIQFEKQTFLNKKMCMRGGRKTEKTYAYTRAQKGAGRGVPVELQKEGALGPRVRERGRSLAE